MTDRTAERACCFGRENAHREHFHLATFMLSDAFPDYLACVTSFVAIVFLFRAAFNQLLSSSGMSLYRGKFRPDLNNCAIELVVIVGLLLSAALNFSLFQLCIAALLTGIVFRGIEIKEHGILAGTKFLPWSNVVGHDWVVAESGSLLVLRCPWQRNVRIKIPSRNVLAIADFVAGAIRPEPYSRKKLLVEWIMRIAFCTLLVAILCFVRSKV